MKKQLERARAEIFINNIFKTNVKNINAIGIGKPSGFYYPIFLGCSFKCKINYEDKEQLLLSVKTLCN